MDGINGKDNQGSNTPGAGPLPSVPRSMTSIPTHPTTRGGYATTVGCGSEMPQSGAVGIK
jgi:hypothetical protein